MSKSLKKQIWDKVDDKVWDQVFNKIYTQVYYKVCHQVNNQVSRVVLKFRIEVYYHEERQRGREAKELEQLQAEQLRINTYRKDFAAFRDVSKSLRKQVRDQGV